VSDTFLTLVVEDGTSDLARTIARTLSPGGDGMWMTGLSPSGDAPVTHWGSSGWVPDAWMHMVPVQTYTQDGDGAWVLVSETPGDPLAVIAGCAAAGVTVDPTALAALFASADVTAQDPFVALDRLGLQLVREDIDA
jgi:hypothetical protein